MVEKIATGIDLLDSNLVINGLDPSNLTEEYVDMTIGAGVDCWHRSMDDLMSFSETHEFVDAHSDKITVVRNVNEISQAREDGKLGLLLGWQDCNAISNGRVGPNDWWGDPPRTHLRAYYELGLRISGIAYQIANVFGGGAIDGHMGLSKAGRVLVEQIHNLGIILDVGGHTGDQASLDAIEMSEGLPVICSHGNCRAIADSSRNLSDEVIEAIAKTGGVIGFNAINDFVVRGKEMAHLAESSWGTIDDMLDHVDHLRKLIGADHIGLGPDFTWGMSPNRDRALFGPEAQDEGPRRFVKGFEHIGELPNVVTAMGERGWKDEEIRKVLSDNWLRVYQQVWGG